METRKISEGNLDVGDTNCILCFGELKFYALGCCGHRNVCHTCALRLRLVMEDEQCPICKTELEEIVITDDHSLDWQYFSKKVMKKCEEDPEDESIYFHNEACKKAALQLRTLNCLLPNCKSS
jgi:E3 ubiquitin-protein ligase ZNF598